LRKTIDEGFGPKPDGEDQFDAFVGICSMLDVVSGCRPEGAPTTNHVRRIEGWILGQRASASGETLRDE
jgi:hypothetical protein